MIFCQQTSTKHLLQVSQIGPAPVGADVADSRVLQQEFVKSECGVMVMWGCESPFTLALWDLLRPCGRGHSSHCWGTVSAHIFPKMPPGLKRCEVSILGTLWGLGWLYPHLQVLQENLTSWCFAGCRDVASQWKASEPKEASKFGLKIYGI